MAQCDYTGDDPNHPGGSYSLSLAGFSASATATISLRSDGLAYASPLGTTGLDDLGIGGFSGSLPGNLLTGSYYFRAGDDGGAEADSGSFSIIAPVPPAASNNHLGIGISLGL